MSSSPTVSFARPTVSVTPSSDGKDGLHHSKEGLRHSPKGRARSSSIVKVETVEASQEELLAWDDTVPTAWPAPGEVDERTLDLIASSGMEQVVVNSANVVQSGGPRSRLAGLDAVVTDARADTALARSIREESAVQQWERAS